MHHPTGMIAHTTAFVRTAGEHWLEWEIAKSMTRSTTDLHNDILSLTSKVNRRLLCLNYSISPSPFPKPVCMCVCMHACVCAGERDVAQR